MIRRIVLENYMSHARTVIEPAPGLTVLVGPNNCGKSAVVSALQTLCGDNAGDFMVRHGAKSCQVTVETDDGHVVTWRRRGAAVTYVIDGREVHRSGRGNLPDDLHEHLRLPKVEAGGTGEKFDVHFALQKAPIFLIDNEGRAAAFFSTSSDAERLLEVQKRHKAKVTEAKINQKNAAAELERLDRQLERLAPLADVNDELREAEAAYERLAAGSREMSARAERIRTMADREDARALYARQCAALSELAAPPGLADLAPLEAVVAGVDAAARQIERHRHDLATLSLLRSPPDLADTDGAESTIVLLMGLNETADGTRRRCAALADLEEPPELCPTEALEASVRRLARAEEAAEEVRRREACVVGLREPPAIADTSGVESVIERWDRADRQIGRLRGDLRELDAQLAGVVEQVREWSSEHPACPVCGAATDPGRILTGGHAHG